jgi:hypothetical protein
MERMFWDAVVFDQRGRPSGSLVIVARGVSADGTDATDPRHR